VTDWRDKPVPSFGLRLDERGTFRVGIKGMANIPHVDFQDLRLNEDAAPEGFQQLVRGHEASGPVEQSVDVCMATSDCSMSAAQK
jgi:hypothetical protein